MATRQYLDRLRIAAKIDFKFATCCCSYYSNSYVGDDTAVCESFGTFTAACSGSPFVAGIAFAIPCLKH